jgi:hypothetical protein
MVAMATIIFRYFVRAAPFPWIEEFHAWTAMRSSYCFTAPLLGPGNLEGGLDSGHNPAPCYTLLQGEPARDEEPTAPKAGAREAQGSI